MKTRECGSCAECCYSLLINEFKDGFLLCKNLSLKNSNLRHRCGIYEDRPKACREFECLWKDGGLPFSMRPDLIKTLFFGQNHENFGLCLVVIQEKNPSQIKAEVLSKICQELLISTESTLYSVFPFGIYLVPFDTKRNWNLRIDLAVKGKNFDERML